MRKKFLLLIFAIFLCVGCKAKYTLEIDKDGKVKESASLTESAEFFERYTNSSTGRVISFILEPYMDILNENNYNVNNNIGTENSGVKITKEYNSIDDYVKDNIFYTQFTDKINLSKDGKKVSINFKGSFSASGQDQSRIPVNDADITIKLPFKVLEHNADSVDGQYYTWKFKNNNEEEREIKIVYDSSKIAKETDTKLVFIFLGIIIGLLVIGFLVYNNMSAKKNSVNKI